VVECGPDEISQGPGLRNKFVGAVIGAMATKDLSTQFLNSRELSWKLLGELVPIIYEELKPKA
jgi:type I restriction enzyme R subunit